MKVSEQLPSEFYEEHTKGRKDFETRAEKHSVMTLPYLIRQDGSNSGTQVPFKRAQSFCGGLVNTLKSKMGMTLLPPSTSSFRFVPDSAAMDEQFGDDAKAREEVAQSLSNYTDIINNEIEAQQVRPEVFALIEQMLVVGSAVVEKIKPEKGEKGGLVIHTLKSFAVKLDKKGNALGICIYEELDVLPTGIEVQRDGDDEMYKLYTLAYFDDDTKKWVVKQEIDGVLVGKEATYATEMDLPFRYLGWKWVVGDDYHRPYVEDYYDDMVQLNHLAELLSRGSLAAAKILFLVDESTGRTTKNQLVTAPTGAYLHGRADDVSVVQVGKNFDFQVPMEREQNLKQELSRMFLSNQSAARQSERTTAYEVQLMAKEIESSTLGGIYSSMSIGFSKWLVYQVMKEKKIKFETIDVQILTGLDALGRSQEAQKLDGFMQRLGALGLTPYVKMEELISRYASYDGINTVNLIKTQEEVQKEQQAAQQAAQQAQQQEQMTKSTGKVIEDASREQMRAQGQQQQQQQG